MQNSSAAARRTSSLQQKEQCSPHFSEAWINIAEKSVALQSRRSGRSSITMARIDPASTTTTAAATSRPRSGRFHSSIRTSLIVILSVATCTITALLTHMSSMSLEQTVINDRHSFSAPHLQNALKLMSYRELDALTNELLGPDEFGSGCPKSCGCPSTRIDCPRHYNISAVNRSANALLDKEAIRYYETKQEMSHMQAAQHCIKGGLETGGWCLGNLGGSSGYVNLQDGRSINIPKEHVAAPKNIVEVLMGLISTENVTSISDYGAGVGQYGAELKTQMPQLVYYGYDGAGDVEAYTSGFLQWFDLTQPLNNPVTDWVLSLEVGEHIPIKYEGMFIRNLHRHNCRGVILSWGILGQWGHDHINNHSNDYVSAVFVELGYMRDSVLETLMRREEGNYPWFQKSVMVFRREQPVC